MKASPGPSTPAGSEQARPPASVLRKGLCRARAAEAWRTPFSSGRGARGAIAFARATWGLFALSGTLFVVAGCAPQLEIVLVKAPDLPASPPFVKFQVHERDKAEPAEFGPFSTGAIPDEQFAPVVPGTPFFIDVVGCQQAEPAECVEPERFVARGCSDFLSLQRDEARNVVIEVHGAAEGAALCPPAPPS